MIEVDDARLDRYHRRIEEEKLAAERSNTAEAKRIHLQLMQKYEQMAASLRTK